MLLNLYLYSYNHISSRYTLYTSFQAKWRIQLFRLKFAQKNGFRFEIWENWYRNKRYCVCTCMWVCVKFQAKEAALTFSAQIFPKTDLELEIQKTNIGIGISILDIIRAPIFSQSRKLWLFRPKFAQKWLFPSDIQNYKWGFRIYIFKIPCVSIFSQNWWMEIGEGG